MKGSLSVRQIPVRSGLVRPLHERLLVRRIEEKGVLNRSVLMPATAKRKPWKGEVVAVGNGEHSDAPGSVDLDVKVGDRVLFGKQSGIAVRVRGEDLLVLPEDEFLVVVA